MKRKFAGKTETKILKLNRWAENPVRVRCEASQIWERNLFEIPLKYFTLILEHFS
jgi:hypothetical protein